MVFNWKSLNCSLKNPQVYDEIEGKWRQMWRSWQCHKQLCGLSCFWSWGWTPEMCLWVMQWLWHIYSCDVLTPSFSYLNVHTALARSVRRYPLGLTVLPWGRNSASVYSLKETNAWNRQYLVQGRGCTLYELTPPSNVKVSSLLQAGRELVYVLLQAFSKAHFSCNLTLLQECEHDASVLSLGSIGCIF